MNNKEFITQLAKTMNSTQKQTATVLSCFVDAVVEQLSNGDSVTLGNLGQLEVRRKEQRKIVNPTTKKTMLVPPKLVLNFKPSSSLKSKLKEV
ncbi:MAG: HU family DNA-binding protein [Paludibacteraceae bacterium]|nr:HU family DNA-binding protein [Paludibacteraceae bacterium]